MRQPQLLASVLSITLLGAPGIGRVSAQPLPGVVGSERTVTLTITPAEVALLGKGLGMLPYNEVAQLFVKLQGQLATQQGAAPSLPGSGEAPK